MVQDPTADWTPNLCYMSRNPQVHRHAFWDKIAGPVQARSLPPHPPIYISPLPWVRGGLPSAAHDISIRAATAQSIRLRSTQDFNRFPILVSFMAVVKACSSASKASMACCCPPPPSLTRTLEMSVKRTRTETRVPVFDSHVGQVCEAYEQPTSMRLQGLLLPCFRCS